MNKEFKHLNLKQRKEMEQLLRQNINKKIIADKLGVHVSTIYREIQRFKLNNKGTDNYSAKVSQTKYESNLKDKRKTSIIEKNEELRQFIDYKLFVEGKSPQEIISEIEKNNLGFNIKSKGTIYNYLNKNLDLDYYKALREKKTMSNEELDKFVSNISSELIEQNIKDSSRKFIKAILVTLISLDYNELWVNFVVRERLEDKYCKY